MLLLTIVLAGSLAQPGRGEIGCRVESPEKTPPVTRTLQDGVVVTMTRRSGPDAVEDACQVEVKDRAGKVVFSKMGFNTELHADSGRDVDNDGSPDLVIGVDDGGGNRCCWEYSVLSLRPAPHVVANFDNPAFESDASGKTIVWNLIPFYSLGPSLAESPTIVYAMQFRSGKLVEVTGEYCAAMLAGRLTGWADFSGDLARLTPAAMAASRRTASGARVSDEVSQVRGAATSLALQMMYCGREGEARTLIERVWPDSEQENMRSTVSIAVAASRHK